MIKISKELADLISSTTMKGFGIVTEYGAVVGDAEFIIYFKDNEDIPYLAHISEFEQDGLCIRLKE
jgi:hypothetical protein